MSIDNHPAKPCPPEWAALLEAELEERAAALAAAQYAAEVRPDSLEEVEQRGAERAAHLAVRREKRRQGWLDRVSAVQVYAVLACLWAIGIALLDAGDKGPTRIRPGDIALGLGVPLAVAILCGRIGRRLNPPKGIAIERRRETCGFLLWLVGGLLTFTVASGLVCALFGCLGWFAWLAIALTDPAWNWLLKLGRGRSRR